jgi:chaperonin GroEL (HSP60 family)
LKLIYVILNDRVFIQSIVVEGFELAKKEALPVLDKLKIPVTTNRQTLIQVACTSLRIKFSLENANILTNVRIYFFFFMK